jgi:hypothetical protein
MKIGAMIHAMIEISEHCLAWNNKNYMFSLSQLISLVYSHHI